MSAFCALCFARRALGAAPAGACSWHARRAAGAGTCASPCSAHAASWRCKGFGADAAAVLHSSAASSARSCVCSHRVGRAHGEANPSIERTAKCAAPLCCRSCRTLAVTCSHARRTGVLSKRRAVLRACAVGEALWVLGRLNLRSRCAGPSVLRRPAHQSLKHHQSKGQHRAGLSVLRRPAHRCACARKSSAVCAAMVNASARRATLVLRPGPASTQRLRCFVLAPRPASAVRPMPAAVWVAFVACKCRKRCAVATIALSASKTP